MAQGSGSKYELPGKLEKILASLSMYYAQQKKTMLQKVVVNSTYHVQEEWTYDNWNGGTFGHAVYFHVPAVAYHEVFDKLDSVAQELREGINRIKNVQNEFVAEVFLELQDDAALQNWRENSGVLLRGTTAIAMSEDRVARLWEPGFLRVFLSHKAEFKSQVAQLKKALLFYGVSGFVAHEDIEPTKEWQDEIERALFSMDAMVPLMTEDFSRSHWTDQEIGVAIGRGVSVIPVRLGQDPYGFIGKYQAVPGNWGAPESLARSLFDLLFGDLTIRGRVIEALVARLERAESFNQSNALMAYFERVERASPAVIDRLEHAAQDNSQVRRAHEVERKLPELLKKWRGSQ